MFQIIFSKQENISVRLLVKQRNYLSIIIVQGTNITSKAVKIYINKKIVLFVQVLD